MINRRTDVRMTISDLTVNKGCRNKCLMNIRLKEGEVIHSLGNGIRDNSLTVRNEQLISAVTAIIIHKYFDPPTYLT